MQYSYVKDLAERVGWTFGQAFLATVPISVVGADWSTVKTVGVAAAVAGGAAVLSLIKGIAAKHTGDKPTASTAYGV